MQNHVYVHQDSRFGGVLVSFCRFGNELSFPLQLLLTLLLLLQKLLLLLLLQFQGSFLGKSATIVKKKHQVTNS